MDEDRATSAARGSSSVPAEGVTDRRRPIPVDVIEEERAR
jgi:hypothetical protein